MLAADLIAEAVAKHAASLADLDRAEAIYALAIAEVADAEERLAAVEAAEQAAAGDMAARIRAAAAAGECLARPEPTATALARSTAEAECKAAHEVAGMLRLEFTAAQAAVDAALLGVSLATHEGCAAVAKTILDDMAAAWEVLERGFFHLRALDAAAFTVTPVGPKRLAYGEQGRKLAAFEMKPRFVIPSERQALVDQWRKWRDSLASDPDAPSPYA